MDVTTQMLEPKVTYILLTFARSSARAYVSYRGK